MTLHHACAAAALVVLLTAPAWAQVSVEVSPLRVELQAAPGSSTTQAVTLTNAGKDAVRVRATLSDWDLSRDGAPQFEGAVKNSPYSATAWVRIAPPEQVLEAGQEGTVRFTLAVPPDVQPAGYRTGILFEFGPASGDPVARARSVQFRSRIATLIYVNIGQPPAAIELTDLQLKAASAQTQVIATLKNSGKRTIRTKGTLTVFDKGGATVREVPLPDVPVLPESERDVSVSVGEAGKTALPPGEYRVEIKIDAGLPALIVGETTLKVAG
jgi:P pilus assembly chaperone PapD